MLSLCDIHGRQMDYLRVSITDRCNLRCQYCMPPEGIIQKSHEDILRYEEIVRIVQAGVELGIRKIRITGGEPLVRLGVVDFVAQLKRISGLEEISMTTNGILLSKYADDLKKAGLDRVNISLDSLKKERYLEITRMDELDKVKDGIMEAIKVGLEPVKINVVVMKGINDDEIMDFVELSLTHPLEVRFIEFMPIARSRIHQSERFLSLKDVQDKISKKYQLIPFEIKKNGPARSFTITGASGSIGFITPISHNFCAECNRIRLTADGRLRPCLDNNLEIDLHDDTRRIGDENFIRFKFIQAFRSKPGHHTFLQDQENISERNMFQIGG